MYTVFFDQFPRFPLFFLALPIFLFHWTRGAHISQARSHYFTTNLSARRIISNAPDTSETCLLEHAHSTSFHEWPRSLISCRKTGRICLIHILHPSGNPPHPLQTPAAVSSSDLWVGIPISFIYVTDQKYVIIISSGFYVLFHFLCIRILVASMVYLKYCLSKREGMDSPKNQGIVITDVICNLRERKAF